MRARYWENNDCACIMSDSNILSAFKSLYLRGKKIDPARIRSWNPLIRSQMPYPLGHGAVHGTVNFFFLIYLYIMLTIIYTRREEQDCNNKTMNHS